MVSIDLVRIGTTGSSSKHGHETSSFIRCREFFGQLRNSWLLKKDFALSVIDE